MCSAKNKKASWATKLEHSSTTKDKKMIHLTKGRGKKNKKLQETRKSSVPIAARNMEERSRSAMDLGLEYEDKGFDDGEGDDSEGDSAGTSRLRKRSFFLMHFDS